MRPTRSTRSGCASSGAIRRATRSAQSRSDGRLYALGSDQGTVRALDLRTGDVRRFNGRHESPVKRLAFTPDHRTLVTTSEDGGVLVVDVANGAVRERLEGHTGETYGLALSTSGATAYTAALDGRTIFWDIAGTRRLATPFTTGAPFVTEKDEFPKELAIAPDGRSLAIAQVNGHVDLYSTGSMRRERTVRALRQSAAVDVSPDGHTLAVAGEKGQADVFDARTLRPIGELKGMRSNSQAVTFSPDGKLVAAGELGSSTPDGAGGRVHVWDTQRQAGTGAARVSFPLASPSLAFSPDGGLLAAAGIVRPTEVREVVSGKLVARLPTSTDSRSVAFSPDGRLLAIGQYDGRSQLFSTKTWKPSGRPTRGADGTHHLAGVLARRANIGHLERRWHRRALGRRYPQADRRSTPGHQPGRRVRLSHPRTGWAAAVRRVQPGSGAPLGSLAGGMEGTRLPCRRARADDARVARGTPGATFSARSAPTPATSRSPQAASSGGAGGRKSPRFGGASDRVATACGPPTWAGRRRQRLERGPVVLAVKSASPRS